MRSFLRWGVVAAGVLAAGGCATMNVSSQVERGLDFAQYHTYNWGPVDALPTGDPRLDKNPFFHDHMQGAVEKALAARGLALSTSGRPDLLFHYHANVTQRLEVNRLDESLGYCTAEGCSGGVNEYEAGTIVLDIVDARTNRVIWRGWAQDRLSRIVDNPDGMTREINDAVMRMMKQLPPTL
jgi:hypothetical protein